MRFRIPGAALAVAALSAWAIAAPANADNYQVRDGAGVSQTFCSRVTGALHFPCHLMFGIFGSTPTPLSVDGEGRMNVNITNASLPSGAALSAKQDAGNASLTSIDGKLSAQATADLQAVGNATIATVATSAGTIVTQTTAAATVMGAISDGAWSGTGSGTLVAIEKHVAGKIEAVRALQATGNSSLVNIDADLGGSLDTSCSTDTGACSIAALLKRHNERLSTLMAATLNVNCVLGCSGGGGGGGDASAAKQDIANAALAAIDSDLGGAADPSCSTDAGACSQIALLKRQNERLSSILTSTEPVPVTLPAAATPFVHRSAASNNSTLVASGPRVLYAIPSIINTTASLYFLRIYNTAAAPTCSSGTGEVLSIPIPSGVTGAGVVPDLGPLGVALGSGLGFCLTGGGAANDNTSAASGVTFNMVYK